MKTVLVRVTGRRSADEDPALAPLIGNARRYVQQYRGGSRTAKCGCPSTGPPSSVG